MEPEDITEIIMRRMGEVVKSLSETPYASPQWGKLHSRLDELSQLLAEIRALKENETKD